MYCHFFPVIKKYAPIEEYVPGHQGEKKIVENVTVLWSIVNNENIDQPYNTGVI